MAHGDDRSLQLSYCNWCLLCHCECRHAVVVLGFLLQLLAGFIVITDDCVVAAAAFASIVVTVALFLLSSLSLFLIFYCHPYSIVSVAMLLLFSGFLLQLSASFIVFTNDCLIAAAAFASVTEH
jgi:hypothetical protein